MNKSELVALMAEKAGVTKADAARNLEALQDIIKDELAAGNKLALTGFGTFDVSSRKARVGRNPQTGAEIKIPATKVPTFKAGKALKEAVK